MSHVPGQRRVARAPQGGGIDEIQLPGDQFMAGLTLITPMTDVTTLSLDLSNFESFVDTDFLYGACLLDWDAERTRMQRYADRFDAADEVRIVGDGTDIRLSIAGRTMKVDAAGANIPGGERWPDLSFDAQLSYYAQARLISEDS